MPKRALSAKTARLRAYRPRRTSMKATIFKRGRKGSYKGKRSKRRSSKGKHKGKRASKKGPPKAHNKRTGSFTVSISSKNHPRLLHQLFESRCNGSVPIASDTSPVAGVCNTLAFIPTNNYSGVSFGAGNANITGLPTTLAANRVAYGPPDGTFTLLYDRFGSAYVVASEVNITITRTGSSVSASDGVIVFALTPVSALEAVASFTNTPVSPGYVPSWAGGGNNNWLGANGAQQWQNCLNSPGTKFRTMGFANAGPGTVKLKMRMSETHFNTEPFWQSNPSLYLAATAPGYLAVGFQNYYVLTYYISAGFAASTGQQIDIALHQKWWVRGFNPNTSLIVGENRRARERMIPPHLSESKEEKTDDVDDLSDKLSDMVSGCAAAATGAAGGGGAAMPALPPSPYTHPPHSLSDRREREPGLGLPRRANSPAAARRARSAAEAPSPTYPRPVR